MTSAATKSRQAIKVGKRLKQDPTLLAKVRRLDETLVGVFGKDTPIDWDLSDEQAEKRLSLHVGEPGKGECTCHLPESALEKTAWLMNVLHEMKALLPDVREWLIEVEKLYRHICDWLARLAPSFKVEEVPAKVSEAFGGEYTAAQLVISSGKKVVEVRPRGVWWLTTEGRVDLVGEGQEYQLALSRKEGGWLWVEEGRTVTLHPLTEDLFIRLVKDCMA